MIKFLKNNKITISIISFACIAIPYLYYCIFWVYPDFIRSVFYNYVCPANEKDFSYNIGTFGYMYGGLNAFLSGLAFIGALVAIIIQVIQMYQERGKHRDEIKVQLNLFKWHIERLKSTYLPTLKSRLEVETFSLSHKVFTFNFDDDYSFKELDKINILEIYKGFVAIKKNREANGLITFFQEFKEVQHDYKTIIKFIKDKENELRDLENNMRDNQDKLCEILISIGRYDLVKIIQDGGLDYQNSIYSDLDENGQFLINSVLVNLKEHDEYIESIYQFSINREIFEHSKLEKIQRIERITKLCTTLANAIPNL